MSDFIGHLQELFGGLGPVHARRMFGGHGIFHGGLMFALVLDDCLYLKADAASEQPFLAAGLPPFSYLRNGRSVQLSYYLAPDEVLEDPDEALRWARRAYAAAQRAAPGQPAAAGTKPRGQAPRRNTSSKPKGQPSSRPSG